VLTIILIEASSGLVLALRLTTFTPEFTRAIHKAIYSQSSTSYAYGRAEHQRWANSMLQYTTDQLWAQCIIRCQGEPPRGPDPALADPTPVH
jgi:hypothetical protein